MIFVPEFALTVSVESTNDPLFKLCGSKLQSQGSILTVLIRPITGNIFYVIWLCLVQLRTLAMSGREVRQISLLKKFPNPSPVATFFKPESPKA